MGILEICSEKAAMIQILWENNFFRIISCAALPQARYLACCGYESSRSLLCCLESLTKKLVTVMTQH